MALRSGRQYNLYGQLEDSSTWVCPTSVAVLTRSQAANPQEYWSTLTGLIPVAVSAGLNESPVAASDADKSSESEDKEDTDIPAQQAGRGASKRDNSGAGEAVMADPPDDAVEPPEAKIIEAALSSSYKLYGQIRLET